MTLVKGKRCSGSLKHEIQPRLPKKRSPEYIECAKHFGLSDEAIKEGVFKLDWGECRRIATHAAEEGRIPPPGLRDTYPVYSTVFRKKPSPRKDK